MIICNCSVYICKTARQYSHDDQTGSIPGNYGIPNSQKWAKLSFTVDKLALLNVN